MAGLGQRRRGRDIVERALRLVASVLHVVEEFVAWVEPEVLGTPFLAVFAASGVGGEEGEFDAKLVQSQEDGLVVAGSCRVLCPPLRK